MRKIYKHGTVLGALAGAMLLVSAQGAMAATEPTTSPEGFGIQANGSLVNVTAQPLATNVNPNPADVATVAAGILTAHALFAHVSADGNTVTAGAASLSALGGPLIPAIASAGAVSSTCTATADGITETSNLATLSIAGLTIPANPGPNTTLTLPGVLTVILNQQVAGPVAGSQTVNALVVNTPLLGGQTVTIGSSTCGPFGSSTPVAGGKGLALGLGALGAGAVGVLGVRWNRRRRVTSA